MTATSIFIWLAVFGTGALSIVVYRRRPPASLWPVLFYAYLASFLWALGTAFVTFVVTAPSTVWGWKVVQYTGVLALPATWWFFGLRFAELHNCAPAWAGRPLRYGPLWVAAGFWIALVTNPWHGSFLTLQVDQRDAFGPIWYAQASFGYGLLLAVVGLFLWLRAKVRELRVQLNLLVAASLIPLICNGLYVAHLVDPGYSITPVGLAVSAGLFFLGIYRERLFALSTTSLHHLIEHESDGMLLLDSHGRLLHSNPAAVRLLEVEHLSPNAEIFPLLAHLIDSDEDAGAVSAERLACDLGSSESEPNTLLYSLGPGLRRWMSIESIRIPDQHGAPQGMGLRLRDVTHLIETRETVREQASVLEAILGSAEQGLLVTDPNTKMVYWNKTFLDMWSIPDEFVRLRDDASIFNHAAVQLVDPKALLNRSRQYQGTSVVQRREEIRLRDGRTFERSTRPLMQEGEIAGRLWSFWDVTEQRRAQNERHKLEERVLDTQRMESLGLLAGGVAHDFNNLLAGIMGNADLALRRVPSDPELRSCLADIVEASRRAAELTNQMLAYAGKGQIVVEAVDLSSLVRETTLLLEAIISKGATLEFELASLPQISGDRTQLRQVIMNLITNASDSLDTHQGVIRISTSVIEANRETLARFRFGEQLEAGSYVSLEVSDTGCGMDEETASRIFEPFFTTKFTGRGLGMAASLGIIRSHGGAILVDSLPGRGTLIQVLLSLADSGMKLTTEPDPERRPESLAPAESRAREDLRSDGVVLVVDDELRILRLALRALEQVGYRVLTAGSGEEALRIVSLRSDEIAVIILDVTMPGLGGIETLRELRRRFPKIPVLLSSGYTQGSTLSDIADVDPEGFIQKPYTIDGLIEELERVLSLRSE